MKVRTPERNPVLASKVGKTQADALEESKAEWDALILRASKSWNTEHPGLKELPRWAAAICRVAVQQAGHNSSRPVEELGTAAQLRSRLPEEIISYLETWAPSSSSTTIQVNRSTRDRLASLKEVDETFDGVIRRLLT